MNVTATVGGNVLGDQEEKEKSMKIKKSTKALALMPLLNREG